LILPRSFNDTGNFPFTCQFPKTYPAQIKVPHVAGFPSAFPATAAYAGGELGVRLEASLGFGDLGLCGHNNFAE